MQNIMKTSAFHGFLAVLCIKGEGGERRVRLGSKLTILSLQPAEHILFYKEFPKMSSSAFSILGPPGPGGG